MPRPAPPLRALPRVVVVDDFARSMNVVWLKLRGRIGHDESDRRSGNGSATPGRPRAALSAYQPSLRPVIAKPASPSSSSTRDAAGAHRRNVVPWSLRYERAEAPTHDSPPNTWTERADAVRFVPGANKSASADDEPVSSRWRPATIGRPCWQHKFDRLRSGIKHDAERHAVRFNRSKYVG